MITTNIISTKYENGKRLSSQIVTYTKSEDVQALADILRQIENIENDIEREQDSASKIRLNTYKEELLEKLEVQQGYVDGYNEEE